MQLRGPRGTVTGPAGRLDVDDDAASPEGRPPPWDVLEIAAVVMAVAGVLVARRTTRLGASAER